MTRFAMLKALSLFLLLALAGSLTRAQNRIQVNAYDPAQPNGLVLIANNQSFFGLRFLIYRQGESVEISPEHVDLGANAGNGAYSEIEWRSKWEEKSPVILRWARVGDHVIAGRLTAPASVSVLIEAYSPVETGDSWGVFSASPDRRTLLGEQIQSSTPGLRRMLFRVDRDSVSAAHYDNASAAREALVKEGRLKNPAGSDAAVVGRGAALNFELTQDQEVGFLAVLGEDYDAMDREASKLLEKPVDDLLTQAQKGYNRVRPLSGGALGESVTLLSSVINWNRYLWPEKSLEFVAFERRLSNGRPRALRNFSLSWNSLLMAPATAMIDGPLASATIHALLEGQTIDGRTPLHRRLSMSPEPRGEATISTGRSMPPIGALSVWRVYLWTRDLELLAWAYPRLKQWNEWWFADRGDGRAWRDGNFDGLLEFGFDAEIEQGALGARMLPADAKRRFALSESGLEERPQWSEIVPAANQEKPPSPEPGAPLAVKYNDQSHTLEFSTVGLNALYALDVEMLSLMAKELGLASEARMWDARHEKIKTVINAKLWNEEAGLYLDRSWDGRFSKRLSLENFYPLVAGLADEARAKRLVEVLRDPARFGFQSPLPSIARNDPAFDGKSPGRGAVWAPMNYLIYLGLKRYGDDDDAAALAKKSLAIAKSSIARGAGLDDTFSSLEDQPLATVSGPPIAFPGLMVWPAIEELITADPWAGLCFGTPTVTEDASIDRILFSGTPFDVAISPKRTVIRSGGKLEIECDAAVRLRNYRASDRAISFTIESKEQVRVLSPAIQGRKITVSIDEKVLGATSAGASASFKSPPGVHKVLIVR
jgi:hypothetical protein